MEDAKFFQGQSYGGADSGSKGKVSFEPYTGLEAADIRNDVNRLASAVSTLATGIFSMILLTVAGAALIAGGTANALTCSIRDETCGSGVTIFWGQICLALAVLIGIVSSIRAMTKSSLS